MMEFDEYAEFLASRAESVRTDLLADAEKIGEIQKKIAQEMIGHESPQWQELAEVTIEEKERLGYTGQVSSTDPLLRTGQLRDSIDFNVEAIPEGVNITLGSDDPVALYQEVGTITIPPRPFLSTAQLESIDPAAKILTETSVKLLIPQR